MARNEYMVQCLGGEWNRHIAIEMAFDERQAIAGAVKRWDVREDEVKIISVRRKNVDSRRGFEIPWGPNAKNRDWETDGEDILPEFERRQKC
jgi:hypothetical protein